MSTNHQPTSILKPSRGRVKGHPAGNKTIPHAKLPTNLKSVLANFIEHIDINSYELLVCHIKEYELDDLELLQLLANTREVISLLGHTLHHFVEVLLEIKWYKRSDQVAQEYEGFLIDLLSAHNYYTEVALEKLVKSFIAVGDEIIWTGTGPSSAEQQSFQNTHDMLKCILKIVPMSCTILLRLVADCFPYFKRSAHDHEAYIHNILKIIEYRPDMRLHLLSVIFDRLICLDVNSPKSEIEDVEENESSSRMDMDVTVEQMSEVDSKEEISKRNNVMSHPIANTLDLVLRQLMKYIHTVCYVGNEPPTLDWLRTRSLYHDMLAVFERLVLPTLDTHHIQYLMFYLSSFNVSIAESFLNFLWSKVMSLNEAAVVRQTAVLYIASFLARATFVPMIILKNMISKATDWIHHYISTQDGLENANSDVRVHMVFYTVCQAVFYVVAFRHKDLVSTRKNLTYLQSLNFTKIVTCRLNPLRVCIPPVVQNFATVMRTYQLAYCYTIIEHNARHTLPVVHQNENGMVTLQSQECLETFFPFDPFVLARCSLLITPIYREYEDVPTADDRDDVNGIPIKKELEDDDFLADPLSSSNPINNSDMFSYGTSPGFKTLNCYTH